VGSTFTRAWPTTAPDVIGIRGEFHCHSAVCSDAIDVGEQWIPFRMMRGTSLSAIHRLRSIGDCREATRGAPTLRSRERGAPPPAVVDQRTSRDNRVALPNSPTSRNRYLPKRRRSDSSSASSISLGRAAVSRSSSRMALARRRRAITLVERYVLYAVLDSPGLPRCRNRGEDRRRLRPKTPGATDPRR
jgi:hypothetical protein